VTKQSALCAGLLLLAMGAAVRAQAIYPAYPGYPAYPAPRVYPAPGFADGALPPFEIMRIVRAGGFTPVSRPVRRGPYYVLLAVDRGGRDMRVAVDARRGEIVDLRPAFAGVPYGPQLGVAPPPPPAPDLLAAPLRGGPAPTGEDAPVPRTPPNPRAATAPAPASPPPPAPAPTRSVAADPAELPPLPAPPPLPRPRPKVTDVQTPAETPGETPPAPALRKPLLGGTAARDKAQPEPIE
jgi:hypothetical protein